MHITSGWAMVIITLIYVIATIAIFITNHKATKIAQEQVAEMRREYDESNRPSVEVDLNLEQRTIYDLRFNNYGKKTAEHVRITLNKEFVDSIQEQEISNILRSQEKKECIIGVGQHYDLYVAPIKYKDNPNKVPIIGRVSYRCDSILYENEFYIDLENYMTFFSADTDFDKLKKLLEEQNKNIRDINSTLLKIDRHIEELEEKNESTD